MVLVETPNVSGFASRFPGCANCGRLKALKASIRSCAFIRSVIGVFLISAAFVLMNAGPVNVFLPTVPARPNAGFTNAVMGGPVSVRSAAEGIAGSPIKSGRLLWPVCSQSQ